MTIRVEPAYDHFAAKWEVPRDVAKRRVVSVLSGAEPSGCTSDERDAVLAYLHGLNGRPVLPTRALQMSDLR